MPPVEIDEQAVRRQLELVLASSGFARNERMGSFLRFIVERCLDGKDEELKESVIAIEVLGRSPDYNPKRDPIVRTEAARLRARLNEYYAGEGKNDTLVIELPKGGYIPAFRQTVPSADLDPGEAPTKRQKMRLWLAVAAACLAVTFAIAGWWRFQSRHAPIPIAVLPLTNLSQDPNYDYFADGLTGELIRNLSIIDGLEVRSQTSSFALKDKPRNVREAGKQLDADYILEGSVLRAGQHLRINVQLVRVLDDFPLWSGRYDRELPDVLAIQDEISRGIVNSLRLKLGSGRRRYEINAEVYDLYLRARSLSIERGIAGMNTIGPLEEVIAKDPSFAPAYADLAVAYATRSGEFAFNISDEISKMRIAAEKAIQLDPLLAQAHYAQGMSKARDGQWGASEKSFLRAIELDPSRSETHSDFAMFYLLPLGRIEDAVRESYAAAKADPLSPVIQNNLAYVLISAGRYDEAASVCEKLVNTRNWTFCMGRARLAQGKVSEAIQIFEKIFEGRIQPMGAPMRGELGYAYALAGRREDAEKLAAATTPINPFNHAMIFAGLGDKDRTFAALDRGAAGGPARLGRALTFPEFALLKGDPRVKALRKKVGLPE